MKRSPIQRKTPMRRSGPTSERSEHPRAKEPSGKVCAHCGSRFTPARPMQAVCGPVCARRKVDADKKAERENDKARKEKLKPISQLEEECRDIVQAIARIRDRDRGCISCDKPADWDGQWHGSHYRAHGGCSSLQFHLWNINRACWICNKIFSGRRDGYQAGIVARYGQERLDWLDARPKSQKFTREYLARFKAVMGKRLRRMKKKASEA